MPTNLKYLLIVILAALLAAGVIVWINQQAENEFREITDSLQSVQNQENLARLILDYNSQERWFEGEVIDGMTVLDALMASAQAGNFEVQANEEIKMIDGRNSGQEHQWICYLEEEKISQPAEQIIKPNDQIKCRYE